MSDIDDSIRRNVRTSFMPWQEVDMSDAEYRDLDRQGLIVHDEPTPAPDETDGDGDTKTPAPSPVPGGRRTNRD